jgi:hypothetical protein
MCERLSLPEKIVTTFCFRTRHIQSLFLSSTLRPGNLHPLGVHHRTVSHLMKHLLFGLLTSSLLISCSPKDLTHCAPGTPSIRVAEAVECTHAHGKFTLPAGVYQPEAQSAKGIYYTAPERLKTIGIIRKGHERGGLFIAKEGWQWAWIGHPGFEVQESRTSFLHEKGIIMPTHFKFEPYVKYTTVKRR